MDGFPDEQVYLLEMEDDDDLSNYGNYGVAQSMEAMYVYRKEFVNTLNTGADKNTIQTRSL